MMNAFGSGPKAFEIKRKTKKLTNNLFLIRGLRASGCSDELPKAGTEAAFRLPKGAFETGERRCTTVF